MTEYRKVIASLMAGALMPLAFAPFHQSWMAIPLLSLLIGLVFRQSFPRALAYGWLFGLGYFSVGVSWVYVSVQHFGGVPIPFALLITFLMAGYLAVYPAMCAALISRIRQPFLYALLAFPLLWTGSEMARSIIVTGFPWLDVGYSQTNTWLAGFAPLLGVYGVSFMIAWLAGLLWLATSVRRTRVITRCMLAASLCISCAFFLSHHAWTHPLSTPITVTLVQGNIPASNKWNAHDALHARDLYEQLSQQHWDSDLIVWPENAVAMWRTHIPHWLAKMDQRAATHHATLLTGIPIEDKRTYHAYNAAIALGDGHGQYRKHHLVPFGEFFPLRIVFNKLFHHFNLPMSDFSAGKLDQPLIHAGHTPLALFICYEIAYPFQVRHQARNAQIIVAISDDAWFGHSIASAQHLQIAQMRAIEMGRPVLFATNNGLTAAIDATGRIIKQIPANQALTLTTHVYPTIGNTPFSS